MHELALSQSILDLVVNCASREGFQRISTVVVEIGAGAAVDGEALKFCFPLIAADTPADGAELVVENIGLHARCQSCGQEFSPETVTTPCPACGAYAPQFLAGREMRVKSFTGE